MLVGSGEAVARCAPPREAVGGNVWGEALHTLPWSGTQGRRDRVADRHPDPPS